MTSKVGVAVIAGVIGTAIGGSAFAAPILADDFESYADTAAMEAVWGTAGAGTLVTTGGNPGQYLTEPGGASHQRAMTGTNPTDAVPLIWEFDFLDDGAGNKRVTGALRDVGGSGAGNQAFFEMGRYNSINNPETGTTVAGYGVRHAFVGGDPAGASGWVTFVGNPTVQTGWHHLKATIGDTLATFELDFGDDGTVDASRTLTISAENKVYNLVRFGGPSDVSSAGGALGFDNLNVSLIPEPASLGSVLLIGAALARRRRT